MKKEIAELHIKKALQELRKALSYEPVKEYEFGYYQASVSAAIKSVEHARDIVMQVISK